MTVEIADSIDGKEQTPAAIYNVTMMIVIRMIGPWQMEERNVNKTYVIN